MTADGAALLRAILAAPADDAPRLVYADWLEENATADHVGPCPECGGKPRRKLIETNSGYRYQDLACWCAGRRFAVPGNGFAERAEFIRVQCALARLDAAHTMRHGPTADHCPNCREARPLRRREQELWGDYPDSTMRDHIRRECPPLESWNVLPATWVLPDSYTGLPLALVRRGFVAEVRAPMAVLVGGPCGRCYGSGTTHNAGDQSDPAAFPCPVCDGSGRTPGVLAALCAAHPLERVVATDREPTHDVVGWYYWTRGAESLNVDTLRRYALPQAIYDKLGPYTGVGMRPAKDCYDALSAAILAHARQLAGRTAPA
jgi:uncharacterized protein (TIGR02996 family)